MNIKFIDANCMVGKWTTPKLRFETCEQLISEMDYAGIEKALAYHSISWEYDPGFGNKKLLEEIGKNPRLLPVFLIAPWDKYEDEWSDEQGEFVKKNAFAVRLFPRNHYFIFNKLYIGKMLSFLNKIRMPLFINYTDPISGERLDLRDLNEILISYSEIPIILSNTSYGLVRILIPLLEKHKNLYIETSTFISYQGIEDVCRRFGAERLMFGTRMPFIEPGPMLARIIYADIKDEEKQAIASGNIEKLIAKIRK